MELITRQEREAIEARLQALIENRPVMSQRIAEARALGDLKENGDYHAAREQQGLEEAEIRRLQEKLARSQVIDENMVKAVGGVVFIGCTVRLREVGTEDEDLYRLVGEASASVSVDHVEVTANSPMGEALLKARIGDVIRVNAPRGVKQFEIREIL